LAVSVTGVVPVTDFLAADFVGDTFLAVAFFDAAGVAVVFLAPAACFFAGPFCGAFAGAFCGAFTGPFAVLAAFFAASPGGVASGAVTSAS